jgi:hypothetical protein
MKNKGNAVIQEKKQWLLDVTWDLIQNTNRTLCQAQKLEPLVNERKLAKARELWERAGEKSITLLEAMETCRKAFEQTPFTFNNGNTFATVARGLVEDYLRNAPAVESQIIRTTISHYVAGTIGRKEIEQVLAQLAFVLAKSPAPPAPVRSSTTSVASTQFGEIRPVAS